uniref:Oxoglutarate-dependent flavonoid 7-O-demethylase 1 n=1 Tax=Ocimum basilicum TaxID=39350 RepID=F7ODM_OCIBA|nr:RecName: Full=Oxoglutarate-dependent flavonoid 7-O-demethylase 1; Short=ObF7ODM1; AltName: Full=2-oxoglutarate-dependent dioxygenase 1; Short=ObDIOX1; AltName: Full=8-hydroxysalvigenin 7-O-demethylase; AltName: Full=Gardenin B 7-O-demethylase [Ocimum basilicum]AJI44435.1 oxoglutarate-dependent flavone 7-O-demethylase [Ocimum basilicum]
MRITLQYIKLESKNTKERDMAESKAIGRSLEVPNVQELAKGKLASVPARYVRYSDRENTTLPPLTQIPVIDMQALLHPNSFEAELNSLHKACKQWGFFQLINHGVEAAVMEKMKLEMQEFFNLPLEEKQKFRQSADDMEGYGQSFVVSDEQKLDWADGFSVISLPTYLRKPHLIPKLPAPFRDAIDAYGAQLKELAIKILGFMAEALGMDPHEMTALFEEGIQALRMNYYPPCPQPEMVSGLCPHSDAGGLTILMQVNEVEGLQVRKDGGWVPVSPLPDAFIINLGDILEIVTNGEYFSVEHQATVNGDKERLSVAAFLNPKMEDNIGPAASFISGETPAKFKTITAAEYFKGLFSKELDGKSYLDLMRIQN